MTSAVAAAPQEAVGRVVECGVGVRRLPAPQIWHREKGSRFEIDSDSTDLGSGSL
ncbi:hypothetical protein D3C84_1153280 [compost metagenome]